MSDIFEFSPEIAKKWADDAGVPYEAITSAVIFCQSQQGVLEGDAMKFMFEVLKASNVPGDYGKGIVIDFGMRGVSLVEKTEK